MRELTYGETVFCGESGETLHCVYRILIRILPPPLYWESYGIQVAIPETGERVEIPDLTVSAQRIQALAALLLRGQVTPCTLPDVIADWL